MIVGDAGGVRADADSDNGFPGRRHDLEDLRMDERLAAGEREPAYTSSLEPRENDIPHQLERDIGAVACRGDETVSAVEVASFRDLHESLAAAVGSCRTEETRARRLLE